MGGSGLYCIVPAPALEPKFLLFSSAHAFACSAGRGAKGSGRGDEDDASSSQNKKKYSCVEGNINRNAVCELYRVRGLEVIALATLTTCQTAPRHHPFAGISEHPQPHFGTVSQTQSVRGAISLLSLKARQVQSSTDKQFHIYNHNSVLLSAA